MKRILEVIIILPLAIVLIFLAVANRTPVNLSINPFDPTAADYLVTVPLFWVIFASLAVGILLGGVAVWLRDARYRRAARQHRREAERLRNEIARVRTPAPTTAPSMTTPALPAPQTRTPATVSR